MRVIRNIANTGRTVLCTIHQPSSHLFSMFDALLLLKKGGEVVYFGKLGENAENLVQFLQSPGPDVPPLRRLCAFLYSFDIFFEF